MSRKRKRGLVEGTSDMQPASTAACPPSIKLEGPLFPAESVDLQEHDVSPCKINGSCRDDSGYRAAKCSAGKRESALQKLQKKLRQAAKKNSKLKRLQEQRETELATETALLKTRLSECTKEISQLHSEKEEEAAQAKAETAKLKCTLGKYEARVNKLQKENKGAHAEVSSLKRQVERCSSEIKKRRCTAEWLERRSLQLHRQSGELRGELDKVRFERAALSKHLAEALSGKGVTDAAVAVGRHGSGRPAAPAELQRAVKTAAAVNPRAFTSPDTAAKNDRSAGGAEDHVTIRPKRQAWSEGGTESKQPAPGNSDDAVATERSRGATDMAPVRQPGHGQAGGQRSGSDAVTAGAQPPLHVEAVRDSGRARDACVATEARRAGHADVGGGVPLERQIEVLKKQLSRTIDEKDRGCGLLKAEAAKAQRRHEEVTGALKQQVKQLQLRLEGAKQTCLELERQLGTREKEVQLRQVREERAAGAQAEKEQQLQRLYCDTQQKLQDGRCSHKDALAHFAQQLLELQAP